ncbi:hypothetical protein BJV82DRAFT_625541 [Fennellomyces sp. T-0311]|nr:hypothetical protein BJV82DRAFT_625541 [Fennellomyces sp. T-0311]
MTDKGNKKMPSSTTDSHEDYDQVINETSTAISRMFENDYVELLDKRAFAQAMKSRFAAAEQDAREIIKHTPQSGRGYVRAGELYAMQGKQDKAAEIYAIGSTVVPKTDTFYARLMAHEKLATEKANLKLDMIARLPLETTFNIFDRLPLATKGACLNVSKVWRERLIKCASAWNTLTAQGGVEDMAICNAIPKIGTHVKELTLACKTKQLRAIYLTHMRNGYFKNLSTLIMTKDMTYTVNRELISLALWETRNTLTHLDVDLTDAKVFISVSSILMSSPNLLWLYYKASNSMRKVVGDSSGLLSPSKLKQLRIQVEFMRGEDIHPILLNCPDLRQLTLIGCEPTVLDVVRTTCANLEHFGYNDDPLSTALTITAAGRPHSVGLKSIKIATQVHLTQVMPFFVDHCNTLRSAHIQLNELFDDGQAWTYPVMKELRLLICSFAIGTEPVMARIIKECPELRVVYLENVDNMDVLSRELLKAEKLTKISISNTHCPLEDELQRLFDKHVLLNQDSSLASIRFATCYTVSDSVLSGLRCLKALKALELTNCEGMSVMGLKNALSELKTLTEIKLARMDIVTDTVVSTLTHIPTVRLNNLNSVSDKAVRSLVAQSKCLQTLELRTCSKCTPMTILEARAKGIDVIVA